MPADQNIGRFCWVDLAASDANAARRFYGRLFGWTAETRALERGGFYRFLLDDDAVASAYQLSQRHLSDGVPSHWTPYVSVADADAAAALAEALGASVIVRPFDVPGAARIALVQDPAGALFGLWERAATGLEEE